MCLFLSGCYNYLELNNIAVVSMLAIDYDDGYKITAEIRENEKNKLNKSVVYNSEGETLDLALKNMSLSLNKVLYLVNIECIVITDNIVKEKLGNTLDYITRESDIGNNFRLIVFNDDISKILNILEDKNSLAGSYLKETITNKFNNTINNKYTNFLINYLSDYYDNILPVCEIKDDNVLVDRAVIFNNQEVKYLDNDEVVIYNLLRGLSYNSMFKINYEDKDIIYRVKSLDCKIDYEDDVIKVKIKMVGNLNEIDNLVLNKEVISNLTKIIEETITKRVNSLLEVFKSNNIDVLGLKKIIYNKTRKKEKNISDIKFKVKTDINIERQEVLFNTIEGSNEI